MTRILYFGDKHERVTAPENRMDSDYIATQMRKTEEIIHIGKEHNVSAYLQPGDLLDSPNPPLDYVAEVMRHWTGDELTNDLEDFKNSMIPLIGLAGNHELFGNNLKTLPKTMIGFLNRLGMIHFATKENPYYLKTEDGATIAITGTHYHLDIDSPEHIDDYIVDQKLGDFHIHIVHGYLTDKSKGDLFPHTLIDHIQHTQADVTITGHDHIGFPLTEINGKWFVNPGAITRMSNDIKEMKRKPKVLLMDITKAEGIKFQEVYLKSAEDGEFVLNRQKIMERKNQEQRLAGFKKAVKDAGITKSTDIIEIIRSLAESKEISKLIRDDIIDRISLKKQEMSQALDLMMKEAYVDRIVLENFQSHAYTDLELSRGLNIFVGETRQGKTAILRGFRWVYENKPSGKRFVKEGTDCAKVTLYLSNGYIITRIMETKRNGKNGYEITDPTTGETAYHNTKILPEVQKILGYNPFIIDKDMQFNLNFMKQGSGWFLIGEHFSAPLRAKIIGSIYGTHFADAVTRDIEAESRKGNEELKRTQGEVQHLEEQIQKYAYLETLEHTIKETEVLLKRVKELQQRKEKIVDKIAARKGLQKRVQESHSIIENLSQVEEAKKKFELLNIWNLKRIQMLNLIQKRRTSQHKYQLLKESLHALRDFDVAKLNFERILDKYKYNIAVSQLLSKRHQLNTRLNSEEGIVQATEEIDQAMDLLQSIEDIQKRRSEIKNRAERAKYYALSCKELTDKLSKITETIRETKDIEKVHDLIRNQFEKLKQKEGICKKIDTHKKIRKQISSETFEVKKHNDEIEKLVKSYQILLQQAGSCPVCYGTIDNLTMNRIIQQYVS